MKDTKHKLYERLTVSLNEDERTALEAMAFVGGVGPATLARQLLLRGVEAYLKDHRTEPHMNEDQIRAGLEKALAANHDLANAKTIIQKRGENGKPSRVRA